MEVSYTIDDSVYLREPVTVRSQYRKNDDLAFVAETCELTPARRHLQFK